MFIELEQKCDAVKEGVSEIQTTILFYVCLTIWRSMAWESNELVDEEVIIFGLLPI